MLGARAEVDRHEDGLGTVCRGDAAARGMTVIDLADDWVPPVLALAPDGTGPNYRSTYLALAQERFADAGPDAELAAKDRYLRAVRYRADARGDPRAARGPDAASLS